MKVLLLGSESPETENLRAFLLENGEETVLRTEKISLEELKQISPEIIVSYNYHFILKPEIFNFPPKGAINLHIAYLPFNRGTDPSFWSHVEGTPKGVSIHYIDEGIDTGDIIAEEEVALSGEDTLATSYQKLHEKIQSLFKKIWPEIKSGRAPRTKQAPGGTFHLKKDRAAFEYLLAAKGWDTPLSELAGLKLDHIKSTDDD